MYRLAIAAIAAMLLSGAVPTANAGTITYNVDYVSPVFLNGPFSSQTSVIGTVTFDTMRNDISSFALTITGGGTPLGAPLTALSELQLGSQWTWVSTPTALYFNPIRTDGNGSVQFYIPQVNPDPIDFEVISYNPSVLVATQDGDGYYEQAFYPASSPGYLVGTAPEPSSYVLAITAIVLAGGFTEVRKRFNKCPV
jgi:hypothetical protein